MVKFINKKTGEIKSAFSAQERDDKVFIKFTKEGKEYAYNSINIEIVNEEVSNSDISLPFRVYKLNKQCYKCRQLTEVLTYIIFDDDVGDDVTYPWDIKHLLKRQKIWAHMADPSIEYYGLRVIGEYKEYDEMLMSRFPERIAVRYSATTKTSYPMNLCNHCGTPQGHYYIYAQINQIIAANKRIEIL